MVGISSNSQSSYIVANLRQINNELGVAQLRIGTGKKINSASDNPTMWSVANNLKTAIKTQGDLSDSIAVAKGKTDTASKALDTVSDLLTQMKQISDQATNSPPSNDDYTTYANKITALQKQVTAVINGASFQGTNLLKTTTALKTVIGNDGSANVTLDLTTQDISSGATASALAAPAESSGDKFKASVQGISALAQSALDQVSGYQATVSAYSAGLGAQMDFLKTMQSVQQSTLDSLVNANLEEESAKVTALQTQQQLAYQALSIGNSSSASILRLFQ
ncbi:flagellin [Methylobacterium sp. ID0610]|uniref:flagellin n=1 Tax=Methylobacterium carpenticola TaxID=3344827 RepID=UPI0036B9CBAC